MGDYSENLSLRSLGNNIIQIVDAQKADYVLPYLVLDEISESEGFNRRYMELQASQG